MLQPELLSEQPQPGDVCSGVNSLHTPLRLGAIFMLSALMNLIIFHCIFFIYFFLDHNFSLFQYAALLQLF